MPRHFTERTFKFTWTYDFFGAQIDLLTIITGTWQPGYRDTREEPGEPDYFNWHRVEVFIPPMLKYEIEPDAALNKALDTLVQRLARDYYSSDNLRFEAANV